MRLVGPFLAVCASGVGAAAEPSPIEALRTVFPRNAEIALALSGAPPHLRDGAAVYAYGEKGYERVRAGSNGITCLLNRDAFYYGARQFKPTCWDSVGASTYVPVMLKVGELIAKGQSVEIIRSTIDAGFAQGQFRAPTKGGVAYMIAGDIELDLTTGAVLRQTFPGHYMFYAIGATTAQLGVTRAALEKNSTLPTVFTGGAGGAQGLSYIIAIAPTSTSSEAHQH
jgi:hypothetical protein